MEKFKYKNKGFNKLPRWLNELMFTQKLTVSELSLLIILVMNADYGKHFGRVCLSNIEIGGIKGFNRNTVSKLKINLAGKGLIKIIGKIDRKDVVSICKFTEFQNKIDWPMKKIFKSIDEEFEDRRIN